MSTGSRLKQKVYGISSVIRQFFPSKTIPNISDESRSLGLLRGGWGGGGGGGGGGEVNKYYSNISQD